MTLLPNPEIQRAREAQPGDVWQDKRSGRLAGIERQDGKEHLIYRAPNGRRHRIQHFKFVERYRSEPR
jgi:hypothetical protein